MSASRERKTRQELAASGQMDQKQQRALEEQKKERRSKALYTAGAVAFVLLFAALIVWNSKVIQRNQTALTIGGEKYTAADVNYYFYNVYSSFVSTYSDSLEAMGLNTSEDLRSQPYYSGEGTWFDFFMDQAKENMKSVNAVYRDAVANGFTADESVQTTVDDALAFVDYYALTTGVDRASQLKNMYGTMMTEKVFVENTRKSALADAYSNAKASELTVSEDEMKAAYEKNPAAYDHVSIEMIYFASEATSESSESEAAAALAAAKEKADEALSRAQHGEELEDLAAELEGTYYDRPFTNRSNSGSPTDVVSWAFEDGRKSGDTTVIEYSNGSYNGYYVVLYLGRSINDYHPVSVRHILVEDKETADEVASKFNSGDKTEESFSTLAETYSTDTGSSGSGGLYEDIYRGEMVPEFEAWCFDSARKPGDTGIVSTDYGYHVMYFVSENEEVYWKLLAENNLKTEAYNTWFDGLTADIVVTAGSGMKYVW